jgi:hypothetical protein
VLVALKSHGYYGYEVTLLLTMIKHERIAIIKLNRLPLRRVVRGCILDLHMYNVFGFNNTDKIIGVPGNRIFRYSIWVI